MSFDSRDQRIMVYYNDRDIFMATWLKNLIRHGHLPNGYVDCRDIRDVRLQELAGYQQCHFFAGIGGWPLALSMAGWPSEWPVWTGSCPCQPFSRIGRKGGLRDERHLWPEWFRIIKEYQPPVIFGEQVESELAKAWIDQVFDDLEGVGYACGAAVIPAASIGAPHIRHRLWFVALGRNPPGPLAYAYSQPRLQVAGSTSGHETQEGEAEWQQRKQGGYHRPTSYGQDCLFGSFPWTNATWLLCRDGKTRPTEPGLLPLADGVPARMGRLRAYGNAIVPQVAKEFIRVVMQYLTCIR